MNSIAKPTKLPYHKAYNFLEQVILDAKDEYLPTLKGDHLPKPIDPVDFAAFIEAKHKAKFVQYVKDRCDWAQIATDDCLVSADDAMECYANPEKFRELVDEALFRHFQNVVQDWQITVQEILARLRLFKEVA